MTAGPTGFIHVYEPATAPEAPTLLILHGTGGDERDLLPVGRALLPEAGRLSPRGKVQEHGRPRFFRRLAEGVFDIEDLKKRTDELAEFVSAAADRYGFARDRILAAGFSNGANIAASLLLLRPNLLRGAILFSPMVPLIPDAPPHLDAVDVFISAGRLDPIVAPDNTQRLHDLLVQYGARVTLRWTPGGHAVTAEDIRAAADWLAGRLTPGRV